MLETQWLTWTQLFDSPDATAVKPTGLMKIKARGWWDRCLGLQLSSFIRFSKYVEILTIYQTWQSQAGTVTLQQNSITALPVSQWCDFWFVMWRDTMRAEVTTRDGFNEMRERREISLKVSGCNDETKGGRWTITMPAHTQELSFTPLVRVPGPGLYCIVLYWWWWWEPLAAISVYLQWWQAVQ